MPSNRFNVLRVPTGGVNRSQQSFLLAQQTAYQIALNQTGFKQESFDGLLNFRPYKSQLLQTPPFIVDFTLNTLASITPGQVRLMFQTLSPAGVVVYFILDEKVGRFVLPLATSTQTYIPFVLQIAIPATTGVTGQCLLYGVNSTDFAALNDQIDIQISDGTHFEWQKNGGGYSAGIVIGRNIALAGTGLIADFIPNDSGTFTGYTATDTWSWKRTTTPYAGTYPSYQVQNAPYQYDTYIAGYDRNVLRLRNGFLTTVGYQRVYGKYVVEFYNHVVIAHFAIGTGNNSTVADSYSALTTPWNLGWSDLRNPDNYFSTLINEADQFAVAEESHNDPQGLGITGLIKYLNLVFVFLSDDIYSMTYVGLPNVMQIDSLHLGVGSIFQGGVVVTRSGVFFIGRDNFYQFDGAQVNVIGMPVRDQFFAENVKITDSRYQELFGFFDVEKAEVVWTYWELVAGSYYQGRQVIYQVDSQNWYFRNVPSSTTASTDVRCACPEYEEFQSLLFGGTAAVLKGASINDVLYIPFNLISGVPFTTIAGAVFTFIPAVTILKDAVDQYSNTSITQPQITTQDFVYDDPFYVKEVETLFMDASWQICDGVQVGYIGRPLISQVVDFSISPQLWTQGLPEHRLTALRFKGNVFKFQFTFLSASGVVGAVFSGWCEFVYGKKIDVEK